MIRINQAIDEALAFVESGGSLLVGDDAPVDLEPLAAAGDVYLVTGDWPPRLALRLLCALAGIELQRVLSGWLQPDDMDQLKRAAASVYERPIFIIASGIH